MDWTAFTDIGRTTPRGKLDQQDYLRLEGLQVATVTTLAARCVPAGRAHAAEADRRRAEPAPIAASEALRLAFRLAES